VIIIGAVLAALGSLALLGALMHFIKNKEMVKIGRQASGKGFASNVQMADSA